MGCGCKGKKKNATAKERVSGLSNSDEAVNNRRVMVEEQKTYQGKVRDALKQLMELRQSKQKIKRNK
jgi:hypothetical protein